jgi:hypothetical protein
MKLKLDILKEEKKNQQNKKNSLKEVLEEEQEQKKQTKNATEKKSLKEIPNFEINNFQKESESSNSE